MTSVLVAYATKMGGTKDIATAIGAQLAGTGLNVTVRDANDVKALDGYDAVVIGSALYTGRWRGEAVAVLARQAEKGAATPVWLFQSGPCGGPVPDVTPAPKRVQQLAAAVGAAAPTTFGGRLEPATARGFVARRMAKGRLAGDFRDFDAIRAWADDIAATLAVPTPVTG
ncbi:MAG: flavodoxin domain-containing protein [Nakamurella sp.]